MTRIAPPHPVNESTLLAEAVALVRHALREQQAVDSKNQRKQIREGVCTEWCKRARGFLDRIDTLSS